MCKVYAFPEKLKLTPELEERAKKLARDCSDILVDAVKTLLGDNYAIEEMDEVINLVMKVYMEELYRYVESLDGEL